MLHKDIAMGSHTPIYCSVPQEYPYPFAKYAG